MSLQALPRVDDLRRKLAAVYAPIADELAESERIYAEELGSRYPFVQRLVEHCSAFQGKKLRPALVLLTARACGGLSPAHPTLAAVVEMIHTATLVHDDILDEADVRRHSATINAEWGNEKAVLLGDYLFTHAFHLAASLDSALACRLIGRATNLVCEGEMMQVHNRGNIDLDEASYTEIIRGKTAELTAVCGRLGAHYAGADPATVDAMDEYGRSLGVAFQIADDLLDLWGEEGATGKTLGTDLEKHKLTLPVIHLLAHAPDESVRERVSGDHPDRRAMRDLLESSGSLDYAWEKARRAADAADECLDVLPESASKDVLRRLAQYVVRRPY